MSNVSDTILQSRHIPDAVTPLIGLLIRIKLTIAKRQEQLKKIIINN